jgi:hypothetical protein
VVGSTAPMAVLSQYDSSDDESGNEDKGLDKEKAADNDIVFNGLNDEEQAKGGAGAWAKGAAYPGPNEEAGATIKRTKVKKTTDDEINEDSQAWKGGHEINKATAGKVEEDDEAGKGGHGLRHGMAGLEAAMAVTGSMAARFAEQARANQATMEEVATEHEAVGRSIVDNQAGALSKALGPKATERTYLAMLNAEGVFSVLHGLQWWAEAPGGPRNQRGRIVAFEGEVRMGTGIPNLWRFKEPDDQLFRLLILPQLLLSDTARYYKDEVNAEYYRTTVTPDAGGPGWAPACGRLIPIPVEWASMFLDYPDLGTAFRRLVDLVNLVNEAERDKYTYLARSVAYACLSASKEEHPLSTMSVQWKRMVMSRVTKMWAKSAWMGQSSPDKAEEEDRPSASASPPTISNFSNIFGGQARRTAVTIPMSSPPSGRKMGTRSNPPKTGSGTPRAITDL